MNKTSLYNKHKKLNAKILPYAGYEMPINYSEGIQFEYNSIRNNVGVFDVSHMGEIKITGENTINLINKLTVNDSQKLKIGDAQYSAVCNLKGGIIDDVILYKVKKNEYMFVVNASNRNKIFEWFNKYNSFDCIVMDETSKFSLIAIQGPKSREVLEDVLDSKIDLNFYTHRYYDYKSNKIFISRTGYTGELGFELLSNHEIINDIWDVLIKKNVSPCGLAVRDILRMEMKYCLYGNDINEEITPIEAGLQWIVNNKTDYIGNLTINHHKVNGVSKKLICIQMIDRCIPRSGYKIQLNGIDIGEVTSGTFSLSLNCGIALAYISTDYSYNEGLVYLNIRNKRYKGKIVKPPFIKNTSLHN